MGPRDCTPAPSLPASAPASRSGGHVAIPLDEQVPDGPWEAEITLRSGLLERSAHATLTFPRAGSATLVPIAPDDARPFLVMAGLLLILLCVGLLWAFIRRPRRAP